MSKLFYCIAFCLLPLSAFADSVNVKDYGVTPNSFSDATAGVKRAIAACKETKADVLVFPEGRYDFWPADSEKREYYISNTSSESECPSKIKNIGLLFENIDGLTIEGNGSLFVFHGKMITWALDNCKNIFLKNIRVDFERPSMSELTILDITPDKAIVKLHPDSWYSVINEKLYLHGEGWGMKHYHTIMSDTITGIGVYSTWDPVLKSKVTELEPYKFMLEGDFSKCNYKKGNILSVRDPIRDHVGAFVNRSENIKLYNVTMHYMHGLGIISQFSKNLSYSKVCVIPHRGRSIASFADGMHFSGCSGYVKIDSCHFKGLHDDPVNVHGTYLKITEIISPNTVKVRFMHPQTYGFQAFYKNDTVAFVSASAIQSKGITTVINAKMLSERNMELQLNGPLPGGIGVGDCIENLTHTPSLTVSNSRFEQTNTRGLLVTTPRKVVIENNVFFRTGMPGILIAGDVNSWFESGAVTDITIRNNVFEDCGYNHWPANYSILIEPENRNIVPGHWVHRNIRIEDNTFKVSSYPVIKAKSTSGLSIKNNNIKNSGLGLYNTENNNPSFKLENCNGVVFKGNSITLDNAVIECVHMVKKDINSDIKEIRFIK